jgi:hypothetical protein
MAVALIQAVEAQEAPPQEAIRRIPPEDPEHPPVKVAPLKMASTPTIRQRMVPVGLER